MASAAFSVVVLGGLWFWSQKLPRTSGKVILPPGKRLTSVADGWLHVPGPSSGKWVPHLGPREKPRCGFSLRKRSGPISPASRQVYPSKNRQRTSSLLQKVPIVIAQYVSAPPTLQKFPAACHGRILSYRISAGNVFSLPSLILYGAGLMPTTWFFSELSKNFSFNTKSL